MTKLTTINGKLKINGNRTALVLARDADHGCCCEDCFSFGWAGDADPLLRRVACTLTIPSKYNLSAGGLLVHVSGSGDDEFWLNGVKRANTNNNVFFDLNLTSAAMHIEFRDTVGGNVGGHVCVCIPGESAPVHAVQNFPATATGGDDSNGWKLDYPATYGWRQTIAYHTNNFQAGKCLESYGGAP